MAQISGTAVGLAAVGGLLVYAALRDVSPLQAMRDVLAGRPPPVPAASPAPGASSASVAGEPTARAAGGHPQIAAAARRYIGVPYRWGGADPATGFDCSGLVTWVLVHDIGLTTLPSPRHTVTGQFLVWRGAVTVKGPPLAGDLICGVGHMAIASGGGKMIEAPGAGKRVREVSARLTGMRVRRVIIPDTSSGVPGTRRPGTSF